MLGLIGLIITNQSFSQRKMTMQENVCFTHDIFLWPRSALPLLFILELPLDLAEYFFFFWPKPCNHSR